MKKPDYDVAAAVIVDRDQVLVARRGPDTRHPGRWEFPGGKVEPGESLEDCAVREIMEEMNLKITAVRPFARIRHEYDDLSLTLHAVLCRIADCRGKPADSDDIAWARPDELERFDLLPPDREIASRLLDMSPLTWGMTENEK